MVPTLNLFRGILLSIILGVIFAAPVKQRNPRIASHDHSSTLAHGQAISMDTDPTFAKRAITPIVAPAGKNQHPVLDARSISAEMQPQKTLGIRPANAISSTTTWGPPRPGDLLAPVLALLKKWKAILSQYDPHSRKSPSKTIRKRQVPNPSGTQMGGLTLTDVKPGHANTLLQLDHTQVVSLSGAGHMMWQQQMDTLKNHENGALVLGELANGATYHDIPPATVKYFYMISLNYASDQHGTGVSFSVNRGDTKLAEFVALSPQTPEHPDALLEAELQSALQNLHLNQF